MSLKYKILKNLGYKPYKYVQVEELWDGIPPIHYWTILKMIKGTTVRKVKFRNVSTTDDLRAIIEGGK